MALVTLRGEGEPPAEPGGVGDTPPPPPLPPPPPPGDLALGFLAEDGGVCMGSGATSATSVPAPTSASASASASKEPSPYDWSDCDVRGCDCFFSELRDFDCSFAFADVATPLPLLLALLLGLLLGLLLDLLTIPLPPPILLALPLPLYRGAR
jgi:hypothetical protein